ncbi:hypothetical protein, partial [Enterobacter roggenkampii]
DRNRSHWRTSKTPSYTKSVSWHHYPQAVSKYYLYDEGYMIWKLVSVATLGVIAPIMYKYIEKPTMHINLLAAQKVS